MNKDINGRGGCRGRRQARGVCRLAGAEGRVSTREGGTEAGGWNRENWKEDSRERRWCWIEGERDNDCRGRVSGQETEKVDENEGGRKKDTVIHGKRGDAVGRIVRQKLGEKGGTEREGERARVCVYVETTYYPPVLQLRHCTAARYPCRLLDGVDWSDKASRHLVLIRDTFLLSESLSSRSSRAPISLRYTAKM